jgi:hypothetical protein
VVVFTSTAKNLLVGLADPNNAGDAFLHEWDPPAGDADAVPDGSDYGPGGSDIEYDGNQDGIADAVQSHVVSAGSFDGSHYVTFAADAGTVFEAFDAIENPSPDDSPPEVEFPWGFYEFRLTGIERSGAFTVTLILPQDAVANTFYMYTATGEEGSPHWYEFLYDGQTGAEINGNVITMHFVNGDRGDGDTSANNTSIDFLGAPGWGENLPVDGGGVLPWIPLLLLDE